MSIVLIAISIVSALVILTVYFSYWSLATEKSNCIEAKAVLEAVLHKVNILLLFELPVVFIIAALVSIVVSHKIAGPVYRLQQVAREVARGDLTSNVYLRHDDELKNLSAAFNSVIDNIHLLVVKDKKLIEELSQLTNTLYTSLKDKKIDENEALLLIRKLNDLVGELKTLILQYKIEKG